MQFVDALKQALAARDRQSANAAVGSLLAANAPLGAQWKGIAELMRVSGEYSLAHRAMDASVAAAGNSPRARYEKIVLLTQTGRLREAYAMIAALPATLEDAAGRDYLLGNTAISLGKTDEGRAALERTVRARPGWGPGWLTLVSATSMAGNPMGERLLADAAAAERQPAGDLARYCYAVGKMHADRQEHDAAFAAFARGAKLLRGLTPYSRQGNMAAAKAAMTGFDGDIIERLGGRQTRNSSRPIFVTGLPRSGTTLVEQILASHSLVADGGEINLAPHVAVMAGGVSGEAIAQHVAAGGSVEAMAGLYLHLLDERFGKTGRVVDKTIDNSRFLGLIATMLPDAPLIWMRRDPLDCAWSCFRTFFIHGVAWSYSLTDIAHHFQLEDALLAYWARRLGKRLLVVPYAELVEAPQDWTSRILAHAGLAEESGAFESHKTERVVSTASAMQVRRPINRDGLQVAAPYARQMQPFVKAYS